MNNAGITVCPSVMPPLNASYVEKTCSIEVRENVRMLVSGSAWAYGGSQAVQTSSSKSLMLSRGDDRDEVTTTTATAATSITRTTQEWDELRKQMKATITTDGLSDNCFCDISGDDYRDHDHDNNRPTKLKLTVTRREMTNTTTTVRAAVTTGTVTGRVRRCKDDILTALVDHALRIKLVLGVLSRHSGRGYMRTLSKSGQRLGGDLRDSRWYSGRSQKGEGGKEA
ncbi:hypothetical protein V8E53_004978 [Lactarius tabidus]